MSESRRFFGSHNLRETTASGWIADTGGDDTVAQIGRLVVRLVCSGLAAAADGCARVRAYDGMRGKLGLGALQRGIGDSTMSERVARYRPIRDAIFNRRHTACCCSLRSGPYYARGDAYYPRREAARTTLTPAARRRVPTTAPDPPLLSPIEIFPQRATCNTRPPSGMLTDEWRDHGRRESERVSVCLGRFQPKERKRERERERESFKSGGGFLNCSEDGARWAFRWTVSVESGAGDEIFFYVSSLRCEAEVVAERYTRVHIWMVKCFFLSFFLSVLVHN